MTTDPDLKYEYTFDEIQTQFKEYPHIVEKIRENYFVNRSLMHYVYGLLYDQRENRKGFPLDKAEYLLCYFNKLCEKYPSIAAEFLPKERYEFQRNN